MAKSKSTKRNATHQNPWVLMLLGLVLLGVSYGAASWAIDNGRISLYAVTFISLFMSMRLFVLGAKTIIRK